MRSKHSSRRWSARSIKPIGLGEATRRRRAGDPNFSRSRLLWRPLLVNWLHQSITYLDRGELLFRLTTEILMLAVAYVLLLNLFSGWLLPLIVSALLVHTAFWLANGNFWASLGHAAPNVKSPSPESTVRYLNQMRTRLAKQPSLTGVMIFGSLARGEWHGQSDVDLRVLRAPGLRNWLVANMLIMHERFRAFWSGQQIDVFLADGPAFLSASEEPLFLVKRDSRLDHLWPDRTSCSITEDHFRRTA